MTKVVSLVNQKGGVGKTATSGSLGFGLNKLGHKVLLIDLDPQGLLTVNCGITCENTNEPKGLQLFAGKDINECIETVREGLDIIPSAFGLQSVNIVLANKFQRELYLSKQLKKLQKEYDYIIIDTQPELSILTINALVASDGVIIPFKPEGDSLNGLSILEENIKDVKSYKPNLKIIGYIPTMTDNRRLSTAQVLDYVKEKADENDAVLFDAIRNSVVVADAGSYGVGLFDYKPNASVSKDYMAFVKDFEKLAEKL